MPSKTANASPLSTNRFITLPTNMRTAGLRNWSCSHSVSVSKPSTSSSAKGPSLMGSVCRAWAKMAWSTCVRLVDKAGGAATKLSGASASFSRWATAAAKVMAVVVVVVVVEALSTTAVVGLTARALACFLAMCVAVVVVGCVVG